MSCREAHRYPTTGRPNKRSILNAKIISDKNASAGMAALRKSAVGPIWLVRRLE